MDQTIYAPFPMSRMYKNMRYEQRKWFGYHSSRITFTFLSIPFAFVSRNYASFPFFCDKHEYIKQFIIFMSVTKSPRTMQNNATRMCGGRTRMHEECYRKICFSLSVFPYSLHS